MTFTKMFMWFVAFLFVLAIMVNLHNINSEALGINFQVMEEEFIAMWYLALFGAISFITWMIVKEGWRLGKNV